MLNTSLIVQILLLTAKNTLLLFVNFVSNTQICGMSCIWFFSIYFFYISSYEINNFKINRGSLLRTVITPIKEFWKEWLIWEVGLPNVTERNQQMIDYNVTDDSLKNMCILIICF